MNIIFLDFDGVVNNQKSIIEGKPFSHENIYNLGLIINATNAKIVLTTTHRKSKMMIEIFKMECKKASFEVNIIGVTDDLKYNPENKYLKNREIRPLEIRKWVSENKEKINKWIAIDDMDLVVSNFVHTDFVDGISRKDVIKAINLLK